MHKFEDYFSEVSKKSITRVAFVWLIFNATCMGWYTLVYGSENALEAGGIVTSISTVAAGLKLYQKGQENKRESKTDQ